jgi:hypothetical protein
LLHAGMPIFMIDEGRSPLASHKGGEQALEVNMAVCGLHELCKVAHPKPLACKTSVSKTIGQVSHHTRLLPYQPASGDIR